MRERIRKIYIETENKVRLGERYGESFWTANDVKQRCPRNARLFILYLADMEEILKRKKKEGLRWKKRGCTLQYTDDVMLLASEERGMRLLIK